jgi:glycine betaine catabolism B
MKLLHFIDNFLNKITMYRAILYSLVILILLSILMSLAGSISYTAQSLLFSALLLGLTCYISNIAFAKLFRAVTNSESSIITGLILFLIMPPADSVNTGLILFLIGIVAMTSKYLLAMNKKHIFNPAALAAVFAGIFLNYGAVWWVAFPQLLPFTTILGLLIVRKTRRFTVFFSFLIPALINLMYLDISAGIAPEASVIQSFTAWPLIFFATVMLTEPRTMPHTKNFQIIYGLLIGILFALPFRLGTLSSTPELALLIGNLFAFLASPKKNLILILSEAKKLAPNIYGFSFTPDHKLSFLPGQYLEWTLPHKNPDSRGNRRFFTIASSPTENDLKLGVKIIQESSSFKKALTEKKVGENISAGLLGGDFTLPKDQNEKLVFIAGGIGITPFRSMIQYIIDTKQKRDITLFYAVADHREFVYKEIFDQAGYSNLLKTIYVITHPENAPATWHGEKGRITPEMIKNQVPDYDKRRFYLSGPNAMVQAYKELLAELGIPKNKIVTDYFPGF